MSYQAVSWALREAPMLRTKQGKPHSTARLVLVALADAAGQRGTDDKPVDPFRSAYPSVLLLQHRTGLSERSIRDALRLLERAGLIQAEDKPVGGGVTNWRLIGTMRRPESDLTELETAREADKETERKRWHKRSGKTAPEDSGNLAPESAPLQETGSGLQENRSGATESGSVAPEPVAPIPVPYQSSTSPGPVQPSGGTPAASPSEDKPSPPPGISSPPSVVESKDAEDEETVSSPGMATVVQLHPRTDLPNAGPSPAAPQTPAEKRDTALLAAIEAQDTDECGRRAHDVIRARPNGDRPGGLAEQYRPQFLADLYAKALTGDGRAIARLRKLRLHVPTAWEAQDTAPTEVAQ